MVQQTDKFPHDFVQTYLGLIAQYIPGETTLNQLRILQYIALRSAGEEGHPNNTEICKALGMSATTVTRAISSFIEAGVISEEEDPQDGRKRFITINDGYRGDLDHKVIALAKQYFKGNRAVREIE